MDHKPRKRFGQNFLQDGNIISKIVAAINPKADELILEIGPGQAALTKPLLESGCELHVIEIDRDLGARLQHDFGSQVNFHLHVQDALRTDYAQLTQGRPCRLVGNLPYNISTPLMFHLLETADVVSQMTFMLQKEVVDRLAAEPGDSNFGRLSVMAQYHAQIESLFMVPPTAFFPPPKVDSAIVQLTVYGQPPIEVADKKIFDQVVRQAFSMRRKTLRNALKQLLTAEQIEAASVNPAARAETLSLHDFAALANVVGK